MIDRTCFDKATGKFRRHICRPTLPPTALRAMQCKLQPADTAVTRPRTLMDLYVCEARSRRFQRDAGFERLLDAGPRRVASSDGVGTELQAVGDVTP